MCVEVEVKKESIGLCTTGTCVVGFRLRSDHDIAHLTISGLSANGWWFEGKMEMECMRTADGNLRAAMLSGPTGVRVAHWRSMGGGQAGFSGRAA